MPENGFKMLLKYLVLPTALKSKIFSLQSFQNTKKKVCKLQIFSIFGCTLFFSVNQQIISALIMNITYLANTGVHTQSPAPDGSTGHVTDSAFLMNIALYGWGGHKYTTWRDARLKTALNIWESVMSYGSSGYITTLWLQSRYKVYCEFPSPSIQKGNEEIHGHFIGLLACLTKCPLECHRCTF